MLKTDDLLAMSLEIEKTLNFLAAYKGMTAQQEQGVERLTQKLMGLFDGIFQEVLEKLDALGSVPASAVQRRALLAILDRIRGDYSEAVSEEAIRSAQTGKSMAIADLKKYGIAVEPFDFRNHTINLIKNHAFEASDMTLKRMQGDVMKVLAKAYQEGVGIDEAAERLESKFEGMKDWELERIARTEVISHQNEGRYLAEQRLGVDFHQWWSAEDDDVRDSHEYLHGQIVRIGDKFENGLEYPGDRSGPIEEWINCRCILVPFIMPPDLRAPDEEYFFEEDLVPIKRAEDKSGIITR